MGNRSKLAYKTAVAVSALVASGCSSNDSQGGVADGGLDAAHHAEAGAPITYPVRVPLTGCAPLYQANVEIGSSSFAMSLDTGSSTTAVAATGCTSCTAAGVSALYSPGTSATDLNDPANATYGDGQTWSGGVYQDNLTIENLPPVFADFVSISHQSNFFFAPTCNPAATVPSGILGLGPTLGAISGTTSILDQLVENGMPDVFAFGLCPSGGNLWLGGYDASFTTSPPQYTSLIPATSGNPSYNIVVAGLSVDGTPLAVASSTYGESLVDTGGPHFLLPTSAFGALASAVGGSSAFQQIIPSGAAWFSQTNCVSLSQSIDQLDAALPQLALTLDATNHITLQLHATESYLLRVAEPSGNVVFCPGIGDLKSTSYWDIGDVVLHAFVTIFDRANGRLGLAARTRCP